jgi:serine/threonine protein phosphatase PrpC
MTDLVGLAFASRFVSHPGAVRTVNEDAYLDAPQAGMWAVADGMGGHEGGELASRVVVAALDNLPAGNAPGDLLTTIKNSLEDANDRIREISQSRFVGRPIGSTIAVFAVRGETGLCLWAGDSRIYLLRDGTLSRLTRDHSRVEELIAMGLLREGEATDTRTANIITRAVGVEDDFAPDVRTVEIVPNDIVLVCSDGLNKVIDDAELADLLRRGTDAAETLLDLALSRTPTDNVTLGVIQVGAEEPPTLVRRQA